MIAIKSRKITRDQLDSIPISLGNLIYCEDTKEAYYDYSTGVRGSISCEILANEGMRVAIPESKRRYDVLYYVELTDKFYIMSIYTNTFIEVQYVEEISHISGEIIELTQGYLHNEIKYFAPFTTSSSVIMADSLESEDGAMTLQDYINDGRLSESGFGVALRTKIWTLNISSTTKSVIINYPVGNYRSSGFDFLLFRNSMFVPSNEYEVNEDRLTLIDENDYFESGDLLTFVFVYSVITNPGSSILSINGSYITDGTISCSKISDSIINLLNEGNDDYFGLLETISEYFEGLKINVSIGEPNTITNPTININGLGDVPVTVEGRDDVPVGLLRGIITLMYTEGSFKVISTSNGDSYDIKELPDTSESSSIIYRLYKNDEEVGDPIEIPKTISNGVVKYCTEDGVPLESLKVGDPYIELSAGGGQIYIPVPELSIELEISGNGNGVSSIDNRDNVIVVKKDLNYLTDSNKNDFVPSSATLGGLYLKDNITREQLNGLIDKSASPKSINIGDLSYDGSREVTVKSSDITKLITHKDTNSSKVYLLSADSSDTNTYGDSYIDTDGSTYCKGRKVLQLNTSQKAGEFYSGSAAPTGTTRMNYDGYLYATRVYNAVYNDYAELFEKEDPNEEILPGDVVVKVPGKNSYTKSYKDFDTLVVGVVSDQYGHLIGGTGDEEYDKKHFVPIGLTGRNIVKVIGPVQEGELLVSATNGLAMSSYGFDNTTGCVFGKVLNIFNYDEETGLSTVEFLIMNN